MVITLTVWQRKRNGGHPTRAGEDRLTNPTEDSFGTTIAELLGKVEPEQTPFQVVAQVGNSSRGYQLEQGWSLERVQTDLWEKYRNLVGLNG